MQKEAEQALGDFYLVLEDRIVQRMIARGLDVKAGLEGAEMSCEQCETQRLSYLVFDCGRVCCFSSFINQIYKNKMEIADIIQQPMGLLRENDMLITNWFEEPRYRRLITNILVREYL